MSELEDNLKKTFDERQIEEAADVVESVIPPSDIIAFNEQRSCADIYRMYSQKQIEINPDFQRGEVWKPKAQTLFIDSLIKQLPIPSLCISVDALTQKRLVIDGLQRITSIIKFLNPDTDWRLSRTSDVDSRISGKSVQEIKKNDRALFDILENVTIPITVIRCDYTKPSHMDYLFQIFHRLNSGGCKLLNQEIRNCIYNGRFNTLLKELARSQSWLKFTGVDMEKVNLSRFDYEERVLRFFAFNYSYKDYRGRLALFLNKYMDSHKRDSEEQIVEFRDAFLSTLSIAEKLTLKPESKNLADAVLVGIAHNKEKLLTKSNFDINRLYDELLQDASFSPENLMSALSATDKVVERIEAAIRIFSRG